MNGEQIQDKISQGIALMVEQNYESAKKEFEEILQIDAKSYDAYIHLGNACANLGEFGEALKAFKNALLLDENSPEALYSIANVYLLDNNNLKAVEFYNKAEKAGLQNADVYMILAEIFFDADDTVQALRNINKAINVEPLDGELRLFKARIYLMENRFEEAIDTLDEMEKILPDAFEAYDLRAQIYCGIGNYEEALRISKLGQERFPDDANVSLSRLRVLVDSNNGDEALQLINQMKQNGHYEAVLKDAVVQESILLLNKEDVDQTLNILIEANSKLDNDADLLFLILDIYGKTEEYERVLTNSELLISLDAGMFYESTARYFHAHSLDKLGRTEEAQKEFRQLTSSLRKLTIEDPSFYEGYIYRLMSHLKLGEYEKALELADYIENLYPDRPDSYMFKYQIYKEQGDLEKAEIEKDKALKIDPGTVL